MPDAARTSKEEVQIAFDLTSPYKSIPRFFGRWISQVSNDAAVNDVARMVHRQLWGFTDENDEEGEEDEQLVCIEERMFENARARVRSCIYMCVRVSC